MKIVGETKVLANHVILNKQVALKVATLHKIKEPYVSKNLKQEPAIIIEVTCAT